MLYLSSVQSLSHVWLFEIPRTAACQDSLSITNSRSLLMSIEVVMPSNYLILCCPLILAPSIFPSIRVFSKESVLRIRWPKYWGFIFNISPSNEYLGLLFFKLGWLDLLVVQWILKFSSVQLLSHVQLFATLWTAAYEASRSLTISWSLPKFTSIEILTRS